MKVAIFGDIHGNKIGLEAVLDDIDQRGGVDKYWLLGDYCHSGGDPIGVLELLDKLPNVQYLRGNTDRYLTETELPSASDYPPERYDWLLKAACAQYWTVGALSQTRWFKWLNDLALDYRIQLEDGTDVLLVHSYPGSDDGEGFHPKQSDDEVAKLFSKADESLIFVGHTHILQERKINHQHILNTGSIGKPVGTDTRATYLILASDASGYDVTPYHVDYDTEAVIQQMHAIGFPDAQGMEKFYRGEFIPR